MGASVLPAVVAAANATSSPVDGEEVTVDATRGVVTRGSRGLRLRSLRCALHELPRDPEANHRAAGTICQPPKCRVANARPDPVFKYCSNRRAADSVGNSRTTTGSHGLFATV